jgi:hypothetical protein
VAFDPFELSDAFAVVGCPVCQALPRIEAELVDRFCRRCVSDRDIRDRVLAVGGLCDRHWWLLGTSERARSNTMVGTAKLLADVLDRFGTHPAVARCPLCDDIATLARDKFHLLLDNLGPVRLEQAPPSWRPCRPHVEGLRQVPLEPWLTQWVNQRQDGVVVEAIAAARRYVRHHQDRHHEDTTPPETTELLAAMAALLRDPDEVLAGAHAVADVLGGRRQAAAAQSERPTVTLAEAIDWARADPASRDAMLAIADRAVAWQPAAEVVIQLGLTGDPEPGWAGEARRVQDAYRMLGQQMAAFDAADRLGSELAALLEEHLRLVMLVLPRQRPGSESTRGEQVLPGGLGPVAGRLVALRDLLRRTVPVDGRTVADLEVPDRL